MREDLCSIPVNDMFEPKTGCPICRMRDMLERRMVEYVTGAAMMEPDVRVETNRLGFCGNHLEQMRRVGNRLSLALLLESRLKYLENACFDGKNELNGESKEGVRIGRGRIAPKRGRQEETCFVCENLGRNFQRLLENTALQWEKDPAFQALFENQESLCLPHYKQLIEAAQEKLPKKRAALFCSAAKKLAGRTLHEVTEDVSYFCSLFDYRRQGQDFGKSRDSIERAIACLTGHMTREEDEKKT